MTRRLVYYAYLKVMTQPSKSDQTRQRILSTGRDLVLQGGFGGIGLSRILSESGVPKGSFYYYFASKEAFGCAMLDDYVADYLTRIDALTAGPGTAGEQAGHLLGRLAADR
ncbi:TetR/AcrR family transcriptional regulator [Loktanella salsilacus]|uniref:TetR/AcrR family transcriptional regulator n=1 Tax=Loktanella salsilacus TaxID=195913 RepID=UPI0037368C57